MLRLPSRRTLLVGAAMLLAFRLAGAANDEADAVARVEAYIGRLTTLSAKFVQVVRNRHGQITDRATGTLELARPNRFRWDYREPYEQLIIADGDKLWLYDSDLQQVTVRTLERGLGATPAMLLSGSGRIGDSFRSVGVEHEGDWTWCRLAPLAKTSDFEQVSLGFVGTGELAAMELNDKLGQTTRIDFEALRRNPPLDAASFRFEPPAGVDVIGGGA